MNDEQKPMPEPVWCVTANIVQERPYGPGGAETRRGTKHFTAGAKVYCVLFFWNGPLTSVDVVGHHRGSHRFVRMVVRHEWLTNLKVELVYSPYVIGQLPPSHAETKAEAEETIAHLQSLGSKQASVNAHQEEQDVVVGEGGGEEHRVDAV